MSSEEKGSPETLMKYKKSYKKVEEKVEKGGEIHMKKFKKISLFSRSFLKIVHLLRISRLYVKFAFFS